MFFAYLTLALCFFAGYSVWKINKRHEAGKNNLIIKGKVEVFVNSDPFATKDNPVLATIDQRDEVRILDFYSGYDFGGIEVELADGRRGYIQSFHSKPNYEIVNKEK